MKRIGALAAGLLLTFGALLWSQAGAQSAGSAPSQIRKAAEPITGSGRDHAQLLGRAATRQRVLLGESTHGTHEYYRERGRISERLIRDHGVRVVAIEGDWTPTWRVNLYVRGLGTDRSAAEAMRGYRNFPQWMWRNADFREFIERVRAVNLTRPPGDRAGIYGMDVYDLFDAADAVVAHLERNDPAAARRVRGHYRCFGRYRRDIEAYARALRSPERSCERDARAAVDEVRRLPASRDPVAAEHRFGAIQAAVSVASAEAYFRASATGAYSWNVRDEQMARNVEEQAAHARALSGREGKVVAWAHNSHVGDARATSASSRGELNLGQLMRQRHGDQAMLIGFFTHGGTVIAAPEWGAPGRRYTVRPALAGSHENLFRQAGLPAFSLTLNADGALAQALAAPMLQRAIGVIYRPDDERRSHYFDARLARQFDALIYFEATRAVEPIG